MTSASEIESGCFNYIILHIQCITSDITPRDYMRACMQPRSGLLNALPVKVKRTFLSNSSACLTSMSNEIEMEDLTKRNRILQETDTAQDDDQKRDSTISNWAWVSTTLSVFTPQLTCTPN